MSLDAKFRTRYADLDSMVSTVGIVSGHGTIPYVESGSYQAWATSALHLLESSLGPDAAHARTFRRLHEAFKDDPSEFHAAVGVFRAGKADFEGGYVFSLETSISGEILGNFLLLAKQALAEGHHDVAAVLGSAALEDALKRLALKHSIDVQGRSLQDIVGALKRDGLISGAQKSLFTSLPKIRDAAMHASWAELSPPEVAALVAFVESFLLTHF